MQTTGYTTRGGQIGNFQEANSQVLTSYFKLLSRDPQVPYSFVLRVAWKRHPRCSTDVLGEADVLRETGWQMQ
jgi:hypothetical protein